MQTTQELFESSTGGAPLFFNKYSPVGATITGTVIESAPQQNRDYEDNSAKFWDDGSPQMMLVVTLQTNLRDQTIEDDDGKRRLFLRWWGTDQRNLKEAIQRTGDKFLRNGSTLTATFAGLGEQKDRKLNPPRVFEFIYEPPPSATEAMMTKASNGFATQQAAQHVASASQQPLPEANDLVTQARAAQLARQQATAAAPPPAQPAPDAGGKLVLIQQVKELAAEGIEADIIAEIVPGLSLNAITAILKV
jgi:hypothetical protein